MQVVEADQFVLFEVIQQLDTAVEQLRQRQVYGGFTQLLETQAGGLQQVGTPDALLAPEIDQAFGPAGVGFA
ncbi:hypothetical protein D3C75_1021140 [compost metagenome]